MRKAPVALLAGLAGLALGFFAFNQHTLRKVTAQAHVINVAGKQRMLCERVVRWVHAIPLAQSPAERDLYVRNLEQAREAWTARHRTLAARAPSSAALGSNSPTVQALFQKIEPAVEQMVQATQVASAVATVPSERASALQNVVAAEAEFLDGMEEIVTAYERAGEDLAAQINVVGAVLLTLSLGIIGLAFVLFRTTHREIAERRKAETALDQSAREAQILHRTTTVAAATDSLEEALQGCLDIVCESTGWPVGHVYVPDPDGSGDLMPSGIWHLEEPEAFAHFRHVTEETCFAPGRGLPGRILVSCKPAWIRDVREDENFPRARQAGDLGIRGAFGFPVMVGGQVVAVLEFFTSVPMEPDEGLLSTAESVGTQIGHVVARKLAAAAVQANEARLRATFETVLDALVTIGEKGIIQSVNPAAESAFGYSAAEMVGRNVSMLMPEPYRGEHDGYLERYRETGEARIIGIGREVTAQRKDGSTFPADLAVSRMFVDGTPQFVGLLRDITERKRVEEMKGEFISTVSHELRTPLTSIRGSLGMILGGAVGEVPEEARELIEIAGRNTDRLTRLINDILDLQKVESGKMDFQIQLVSLQSFLRETLEANRSYAEQFGVSCVLLEPVEDVEVLADGDRLTQVLTNLLSNAVKFSPASGEVLVAAVRAGSKVRISVQDQGDGIPEEFHEKLFERFTQAEKVDTRRVGGTGLGLSICKAIMEEMGGSIEFQTQQGCGTTFFIELPVAAQPRAVAEEGPNQRRVLVCEDDADVARLLAMILGQHGYTVDVAGSAAEAKERLGKQSYRAMTLDLGLPDQDGIALLRELRGHPETAALPIVVVSASGDSGRRRLNGDALEIVDFIEKPIDEARLLDTLTLALRRTTTARPRILHIEDDADLRRVVGKLLDDRADLVPAGTLGAALEKLRSEQFNLVIMDVGLPDGSGLTALRECDPGVPVILFSGQQLETELSDAVSAMLVKSEATPEQLIETIVSLLDEFSPDD